MNKVMYTIPLLICLNGGYIAAQNCYCDINSKNANHNGNIISVSDTLNFMIPFDFKDKNFDIGKNGFSFSIKINSEIQLYLSAGKSESSLIDSIYKNVTKIDSTQNSNNKIINKSNCNYGTKSYSIVRSQYVYHRVGLTSYKKKYIYYVDYLIQKDNYLYRITISQLSNKLKKVLLFKYMCAFLNTNLEHW